MRCIVLAGIVALGLIAVGVACGFDGIAAGPGVEAGVDDGGQGSDVGSPIYEFDAGSGGEVFLDGGELVLDAAAEASAPSSCGDLVASGKTTDGMATLYARGDSTRPFTVWCAGMPLTPRTYLTVTTVGSANTSGYDAARIGATSVVTKWTRVRLDPTILAIRPGDYAFSTSTGSVNHDDPSGVGKLTQVPYGVARDCSAGGASRGRANVDLTGLPFRVDMAKTAWRKDGYLPGGSATPRAADRVVDVTGGGFCGWAAPGADRLGGSPIYLVYAP